MTACVLWVFLGNPANYHCAEAYRKAMGLNLKERSSGRHEGQLKITKRGPGVVRRWLFFGILQSACLCSFWLATFARKQESCTNMKGFRLLAGVTRNGERETALAR